MRIFSHKKGDSVIEDMNHLASYLMRNKFAETENEDTGFQETSVALCDYEVHVIKIRKFRRKK